MRDSIDAHCHIGEHLEFSLTPEALLAKLDEFGIAKAIVCPMGRQMIFDIRNTNEKMAELVSKHPERLVGFACANPWYENIEKELADAVNLMRLKGIVVEPVIQGFPINHEIMNPIMHATIEFNVPIYIHTGTPIYSLPLHVADLARRFPDSVVIMGSIHSDFWIDVLPALQSCKNLFIDTSAVMVLEALKAIIKKIGIQRVLLGSDSPYQGLDMVMARVKSLQLSAPEEEELFWGNITRILKWEV